MRGLTTVAILVIMFLSGCQENTIYHEYNDFKDREWRLAEPVKFQVTVTEPSGPYNVYCNIRNSSDYPYARLFVNVELADSTGKTIQKKLITHFLFEEKSGKPFGKTGLGDLYDHQITLFENYSFPSKGVFNVTFVQYNRTDTLTGIVSAGLEVEKVSAEKK